MVVAGDDEVGLNRNGALEDTIIGDVAEYRDGARRAYDGGHSPHRF